MSLFLVTSVCDEGVYPTNFQVVEAESREAVAGHILARPHGWERFLRNTKRWWDRTYHEYKYGEPRYRTAAEFLAAIDTTHVDGDSSNQLRIHPVGEITRIPGESDAPHVVWDGGREAPGE